MKRYWYKVYVKDIFSRERMQMPDWLFRRLIEFEAFAADFGEEGLLPPVKDMAWELRPSIDETKLSEALTALSAVGEVEETPRGWRLTHFERRQGPVPDIERKRKSRERHDDVTKRDDSVTDDVTPSSLSSSKSPSISSEEEGGMGGETPQGMFAAAFGKFYSKREESRWVTLFEALGKVKAEELIAWAFKKEIHLDNRGGLLDSLETAAKNWKGSQATTPASNLPKGAAVAASWLAKRKASANGN
jgi:hypothetical protein